MNSNSMKTNSIYSKQVFLAFGLASIVFLTFCSFFWNHLPMSESVHFYANAETFEKAKSIVWHPPIYTILFHFFYRLLNESFFAGYIVGMLSVLLSGWLIYSIIKFHDATISRRSSLLFLLLIGYFSLPVIIHGVFIFDIDNTILTPALLFTYLRYLHFQRQGNWKNAGFLFFSITLSLWCKMTTPVLLVCSIGFYHLIIRDFKPLLLRLLPIFVTSLVTFYICYGWLYTKYILSGYGSFQVSGGKTEALLKGMNTFRLPFKEFLFSISSNLGAIIMWTSPILFIIFIVVLSRLIKRDHFFKLIKNSNVSLQKNIIPIIFIFSTTFSYTFLLKIQASAGFPKYHYPIIAFLFIIMGIQFLKHSFKPGKFDAFLLLITLTIYTFLLKDVLNDFYLLGRAKEFKALIVYLIKINSVVFLPIIFFFVIKKFRESSQNINWLAYLLVFLVAVNLSGFFNRAGAEYSTNYHYGVLGTNDAMEFANKIPIEQSINFPFVGIFINKNKNQPNTEFGRLNGTNPLKPDTDYLIITDYILNSNNFFYGAEYVKNRYKRIKTIKSYGVWKRK